MNISGPFGIDAAHVCGVSESPESCGMDDLGIGYYRGWAFDRRLWPRQMDLSHLALEQLLKTLVNDTPSRACRVACTQIFFFWRDEDYRLERYQYETGISIAFTQGAPNELRLHRTGLLGIPFHYAARGVHWLPESIPLSHNASHELLHDLLSRQYTRFKLRGAKRWHSRAMDCSDGWRSGVLWTIKHASLSALENFAGHPWEDEHDLACLVYIQYT
jgi:hypothetical protein